MYVLIRYSPGRKDDAEYLRQLALRNGLDAILVEENSCRYCKLIIETPIGEANNVVEGEELIKTLAARRRALLEAAARA